MLAQLTESVQTGLMWGCLNFIELLGKDILTCSRGTGQPQPRGWSLETRGFLSLPGCSWVMLRLAYQKIYQSPKCRAAPLGGWWKSVPELGHIFLLPNCDQGPILEVPYEDSTFQAVDSGLNYPPSAAYFPSRSINYSQRQGLSLGPHQDPMNIIQDRVYGAATGDHSIFYGQEGHCSHQHM